jgi:hypothetical protein
MEIVTLLGIQISNHHIRSISMPKGNVDPCTKRTLKHSYVPLSWECELFFFFNKKKKREKQTNKL